MFPIFFNHFSNSFFVMLGSYGAAAHLISFHFYKHLAPLESCPAIESFAILHSCFFLQTPNSKLQTPNSKLQTPNSKLQTPYFFTNLKLLRQQMLTPHLNNRLFNKKCTT